MQKRKPFTAFELEKLRDEYPIRRTADIAEEMGRTVHSVYRMAYLLDLKKSAAFLASDASGRNHLATAGQKTRFQKGHHNWNTGKTGLCMGGKETQFKPGGIPHNALPVGSIIKATIGYLKIKVAEPNAWRWLHKKNWEDTNGPIPKGMVLAFKDGDHDNCAVDNLELLTRKQIMARNTLHNYPPQITELVHLRAAIVRKINKRTKP
jgi:hypothetical protein